MTEHFEKLAIKRDQVTKSQYIHTMQYYRPLHLDPSYYYVCIVYLYFLNEKDL